MRERRCYDEDMPLGRLKRAKDDLPSPDQLRAALGPTLLKAGLRKLSGWRYQARGRSIAKEYRTASFEAAVKLIGRIARLADKADHHPDLHLTRYRRLRVVLTTHSAKGVTQLDLALAAKIDHLLK
ncbi:MAG: putative pterin-4-alpha-carbinolamine dehydratase [Candidatus Omnitrophica bacterium]|nr:putative pterin-4-alpha-carbinolamine dehydratase [Candidatus Omnitrophota bacterium]